MEDEKRKAGSYEIIQAYRIGDREIVLGEDLNAKPEERYMCAYCQQNEIAALYNEVMVSDDYCEIVKLFADRLSDGENPCGGIETQIPGHRRDTPDEQGLYSRYL